MSYESQDESGYLLNLTHRSRVQFHFEIFSKPSNAWKYEDFEFLASTQDLLRIFSHEACGENNLGMWVLI